MKNIRNQKIHHEEVNEIFQKVPNRFFALSTICVLLTVIILFLASIFFTYEESETINLKIEMTDSIDFKIKDFDKEIYATAELNQSKYGALNDRTNIELSFKMYPKEIYGTIDGVLIKSTDDKILENGLVVTFVKLPKTRKSNFDSIIRYRKGMKATGKIVYSEKLIIDKIFE
jgi:hypothetical protein|nr:hypothetical protein [uncultured Psychroserpens sp.]